MSTLQGLEAPNTTRDRLLGPIVFRKTDAGHAELQQRAASSSALRLRWALVMIDGRTPAGQMVERLGSIGIDEAMFLQLELLGFIEPVPGDAESAPATVTAPAAAKPVPTAPARPAQASPIRAAGQPVVQAPVAAGRPAERSSEASADATPAADASVRRLAELEAFFAGTIRELIGLRGLMLQLAAERAATLDDYRALRDRYVAAIAKARGPLLAEALGARLDALLR